MVIFTRIWFELRMRSYNVLLSWSYLSSIAICAASFTSEREWLECKWWCKCKSHRSAKVYGTSLLVTSSEPLAFDVYANHKLILLSFVGDINRMLGKSYYITEERVPFYWDLLFLRSKPDTVVGQNSEMLGQSYYIRKEKLHKVRQKYLTQSSN